MTETLGRYQLLEHLDDGGTADVYRANNGGDNPDIALKVLKQELRDDPHEVERFLAEAELLRRLAHPGLPRILATGSEDGTPYLVMELLRGRSLAEHLQQCGPLPEQEALSIACDLADTLDHVHREGLVHRDLKPANILLRENTGRAVIMDFGVARVTGASAAGNMATPRYMSPEQAGGDRVDGRSDLFSLGVILFEMLTGQPPFAATSLEQLVDQVRSEAAPALTGSVTRVGSVLRRLLEKDPSRRYATAREARDALLDINEEHSAAAIPRAGWLLLGAVAAAAVILWILA